MTYEEESVTRELVRHYLEQARRAATRLPEFEGVALVRKIDELLGLRPLRSDTPRAHLRALPTWGRDPDGEAA